MTLRRKGKKLSIKRRLLSRLRSFKERHGLKTFQLERVYAVFILTSIGTLSCLFLGTDPIAEALAGVASFFTFNFIQIMSRSTEKEKEKELRGEQPDVECYKQGPIYYLLKEVVWISFFIYVGAYAPIACSILVFTPYNYWRKIWREDGN